MAKTRLFTAIFPPEPVQDQLAELWQAMPGAEWIAPDQIHLTLCFLGDVSPHQRRDLADALQSIRAPQFTLQIQGVGFFPPRGQPRVLWAGVRANPQLTALQQKIEKALNRIGFPSEPRKWHPHLTLARLKRAPEGKTAEFLTEHALLQLEPFLITEFHLMASLTLPEGSEYVAENSFDLMDAD